MSLDGGFEFFGDERLRSSAVHSLDLIFRMNQNHTFTTNALAYRSGCQ
jgi:hypothetical protein